MSLIFLWMFIFAAVHSLTADKRFKVYCTQKLGERLYHGWYRLAYNIVSLVMLAPLFPYMWSVGTELYRVTGTMAMIFRVIQTAGSVGLALSLIQIDFWRFAGIRQAVAFLTGASLPLADEPLQTRGVYNWVRHPLYFFSLLTLWFSPGMTNTGIVFNSVVSLYFIIGSRFEEGRLLGAYGAHYADYQRRVPWFLPVPRPKM